MTSLPTIDSTPSPFATTPSPSTGSGAATGSTGASNSTLSASSDFTSDDFMTLLVAQLKNQDPTNPIDPTTFVSQLVQFNSLEQLIGINQDLTPQTSTPGTSSTQPSANAIENS